MVTCYYSSLGPQVINLIFSVSFFALSFRMLNYYKKYEVETLVMGYIGFKVPLFVWLSLSVVSFMNIQGSFFFARIPRRTK